MRECKPRLRIASVNLCSGHSILSRNQWLFREIKSKAHANNRCANPLARFCGDSDDDLWYLCGRIVLLITRD